MGERFEVGQVVWLKSGGPPMTVKYVAHADAVFCCWFDGGELREGRFDPQCLTATPEHLAAKEQRAEEAVGD